MRLIAAIVFGLLLLVGLTVWLFNSVAGPGRSDLAAAEGLAAFLTGTLGLLLVDITDNLARIVRRQEQADQSGAAALDRELQGRQAATLADAAEHARRGESIYDPVPPGFTAPPRKPPR